MIAIGVVFNLAGLGVFCWLLFALAVYALPSFAAITAAFYAYHSGAGPVGALIFALLTGAATLAAAQVAFNLIQSRLLRFVLALLFAAPAALAGFWMSHGLAALTMPSQLWQNIFAIIGAIVVGATAWLRLTDAPLAAEHGSGSER